MTTLITISKKERKPLTAEVFGRTIEIKHFMSLPMGPIAHINNQDPAYAAKVFQLACSEDDYSFLATLEQGDVFELFKNYMKAIRDEQNAEAQAEATAGN